MKSAFYFRHFLLLLDYLFFVKNFHLSSKIWSRDTGTQFLRKLTQFHCNLYTAHIFITVDTKLQHWLMLSGILLRRQSFQLVLQNWRRVLHCPVYLHYGAEIRSHIYSTPLILSDFIHTGVFSIPFYIALSSSI